MSVEKRRVSRSRCALVGVAWLCGPGCLEPDTQQRAAAAAVTPVKTTGALLLQLQLGGFYLSDIAYGVSRQGGVLRSGHFVVDGARERFSAVLGGLAANDDYTIALEGAAVAAQGENVACTGAAAFDIGAGENTALGVPLRCEGRDLPKAPSGNVCPRINAIRAIPGEAPVGGSVVLKGEVHDPDEGPARLAFAWSADFGALTEVASAKGRFACTRQGVATIGLRVSDGDASCPEESVFVYVTCFAAEVGAGGRPAAVGGAGGALAGAAQPSAGVRAVAVGAGASGSAGASAGMGGANAAEPSGNMRNGAGRNRR